MGCRLARHPLAIPLAMTTSAYSRLYVQVNFLQQEWLHARSVYTCALSFLFAQAAFLASLAKRQE